MDKNTVIGMLLMCAVIFGFMYLQPKEEQQSQQQTTTTENAGDKVANANVDTLTSEEFARLDTLVAKNGNITMEGVNLTSEGGKATGTVKIENKTINLASLSVPKSDMYFFF